MLIIYYYLLDGIKWQLRIVNIINNIIMILMEIVQNIYMIKLLEFQYVLYYFLELILITIIITLS